MLRVDPVTDLARRHDLLNPAVRGRVPTWHKKTVVTLARWRNFRTVTPDFRKLNSVTVGRELD